MFPLTLKIRKKKHPDAVFFLENCEAQPQIKVTAQTWGGLPEERKKIHFAQNWKDKNKIITGLQSLSHLHTRSDGYRVWKRPPAEVKPSTDYQPRTWQRPVAPLGARGRVLPELAPSYRSPSISGQWLAAAVEERKSKTSVVVGRGEKPRSSPSGKTLSELCAKQEKERQKEREEETSWGGVQA